MVGRRGGWGVEGRDDRGGVRPAEGMSGSMRKRPRVVDDDSNDEDYDEDEDDHVSIKTRTTRTRTTC